VALHQKKAHGSLVIFTGLGLMRGAALNYLGDEIQLLGVEGRPRRISRWATFANAAVPDISRGRGVHSMLKLPIAAMVACVIWPSQSANAQDAVKVGLIIPLTGPFASTGRQVAAGADLYNQQRGKTVEGRTIELIVRDDGGAPDSAKRIAQELIVNEKVNVLAGFGLTPIAFAVAPRATEAKIPMVVMAAATSSVTERSPFIVRTSFAQAQPVVVIADFEAKQGIKKVVTIVSDFAPGYDSEKFFNERFAQAGGQVVASLRVPLQNPDFAPFLQRARDAAPDGLFVFVPAGQAGAFIRQFVERGLDKSGIKLFGAGDLTDDDLLNGMGDVVIGTETAYFYSASHSSESNKAFVEAFKKANSGMRPNFFGVSGYDGMYAIYHALKQTRGSTEGTAMIDAMKGMAWESPRGPVMIDPETRDIIQDIYIRRVEKRDGELWNTEFATFAQVKDPVKAAKK
jgi:branched-chain amino acid transport system substrate-binding protein